MRLESGQSRPYGRTVGVPAAAAAADAALAAPLAALAALDALEPPDPLDAPEAAAELRSNLRDKLRPSLISHSAPARKNGPRTVGVLSRRGKRRSHFRRSQ